jgi:type IV pilus assembly protein PilA
VRYGRQDQVQTRRRFDDGFTLIELMVVVLVIAILLAIAIPTFIGARSRAHDSVARSSLRQALTTASAVAAVGTVSAANAATLAAEEPSLTFVDAPAASTGSKVVSVTFGSNAWTAAVLSASGTCWWTRLDSNGATTNGSMTTPCQADLTNINPVTSGLVVAFDANVTASMTQDAAGAVPVTGGGQNVCRWTDLSGTTNHATQATAARCPTYGTDGGGGYLNYAANGWLTLTPSVSPDMSVFVVAQSNTNPFNNYGWIASARGANGFMIHPWLGSNYVSFFGVDNTGNYASISPAQLLSTVTAPTLYALTAGGTGTLTGHWGINGADTAYSVAGVPRSAGAITVTLGADGADPARTGDGKIREVVLYNRVLTATERVQVENYLRTKWGTG